MPSRTWYPSSNAAAAKPARAPCGATNRYIATAGVVSFDSSMDSVNGTNVVCSLLFRKSFDQPNGSSAGTISPRRAAPTTLASDTISRSCASASRG